jgi:molybdopterin converting factor small subunit
VKVIIPSPLHSYTGRRAEVEAEGGTLATLLDDLDARYPGIRFRIIDEQDQIRPHILFFVNGTVVREIAQPLGAGDEVHIVASLSGG